MNEDFSHLPEDDYAHDSEVEEMFTSSLDDDEGEPSHLLSAAELIEALSLPIDEHPEWQDIVDRLDLVAPSWSHSISLKLTDSYAVVIASITIPSTDGWLSREGISVARLGQPATIMGADEDALVRAAAKFGVGRVQGVGIAEPEPEPIHPISPLLPPDAASRPITMKQKGRILSTPGGEKEASARFNLPVDKLSMLEASELIDVLSTPKPPSQP